MGEHGSPGHDDGYSGPATLSVDGREVACEVVLDARHEPHDGRLHWYGRLRLPAEPEPPLAAALAAPGARITLTAGGPPAVAAVGDRDPWGRYRVTGVGTPPYRCDPSPLP